jgi:hypothetical protein
MRLYAILCATLLLVGCTKTVPVEKREYVGEWQEKTMYLLITQDGSVSYKRVKGAVTTSVSSPLRVQPANNAALSAGVRQCVGRSAGRLAFMRRHSGG